MFTIIESSNYHYVHITSTMFNYVHFFNYELNHTAPRSPIPSRQLCTRGVPRLHRGRGEAKTDVGAMGWNKVERVEPIKVGTKRKTRRVASKKMGGRCLKMFVFHVHILHAFVSKQGTPTWVVFF